MFQKSQVTGSIRLAVLRGKTVLKSVSWRRQKAVPGSGRSCLSDSAEYGSSGTGHGVLGLIVLMVIGFEFLYGG